MKIKIKLIIFLIFLLIYITLALPPLTSHLNILNKVSDNKEMVQVLSANGEIEVELEEYLVGVLAAEMPATFELEALKAQAVASRTFAYSRKLKVDDTTSTQVYQNDEVLQKKWQEKYKKNIEKIRKAIDMTKGQVIMYKGEIIHAFFFSSSNGKTNNSEDYWASAYPYLKSVDSHYDSIKKDNIRIKEFTNDELKNIFNEKINKIEILSTYENEYVKEVLVNDKKYSGREIREKCKLSSSSFTLKKTLNGYQMITIGSGHGVGMSQYGAQGMALEGYDYKEILNHYYKNVDIVNK